ncbi:DUF1516 family protein [Lactiplantibacillus garii]|uniref:DUF1516 family protein n=1 Tax=Lactiplantibacillus garii TaxID=2306423 RepID=A0A426D797_9LACO|nr:DUF1516 family protein [Lactiplantibacillus garii]RRK10453.1 DUF1516 family protein [Lactiplantibacillus garii]
MFLMIHIGGWLWLTVMVLLGLSRKSVKAANRYLILSRLGYLLLIITGVYLATKTFGGNWWLTLIKAVLGIGTIGLIEIAFARKQESHLTGQLLGLLTAGIVVTVVCGALLHLSLTGNWI